MTIYDLNDEKDYIYIVSNQLRYKCRGTRKLSQPRGLSGQSGSIQPTAETATPESYGKHRSPQDSTDWLPAQDRHYCRRNCQSEPSGCLEQSGGTVPSLHLSGIGNTGTASLHRRFAHGPEKIAKADEELDKLATELTLDQIHYQSDAVYWNASAALATLKAAARFEGIVSQQYNIIQDRFNDGAISRTDLLMISTRKKEAELQYIKARQNYTLALQQLNILMGVKPDAAVDSLCEIGMHCPPVDLLSLDEVLSRRADYAGTHVSIARSEAQRKAALSQYNPQLSMFLATGWDTGIAYMGQDVPHTPIAGINLNIPIFRWGARFKTNRQQKAYIGIQKLQQSYVADTILEELSAATTKLTETEQQVKTARENMALAEENLDLVTFSYNEGKASMVDVLSAQLSWTQAQTNLINAHLAAKMALAEYRKAISE